MASVNVVTDGVDHLKSLLGTVSAVQQKIVTLYDQDDLLGLYGTKLGMPACGVIYIGLRAKIDSKTAGTGLAADMVCDVYLVGGEQCKDASGALTISTVSILDDMRKAIRLNRLAREGARRVWKFVYEIPTEFGAEHIGYVQRWQTTVILTGN